MTTDATDNRDLACSTMDDLVSWQRVEHASGRRGRRYTFAGRRPAQLATTTESVEAIRILLAG